MVSLAQDFRYALRQLRKSPGYAVVALITLALGIGANTAIFLLTWSILLKSLPVPHPGELVRYTFTAGPDRDIDFNYVLYEALHAHQTGAGVFASNDNDVALQNDHGSSESIHTELATGSIFRVLELHPILGRGFTESAGEKDQPLQPEALLMYDFWRTHFNADPHILGRTLVLGAKHTPVTIVGVLPPGFDGISPDSHNDILLPLSFDRIFDPPPFSMIDQPGAFWLTVMGRLRPGQSLASAQAALASSATLITNEADPQHKIINGHLFGGGYKLGLESGRTGESGLRSTYRKPLLALESLCALMMLLCAVNTGLLILSRVSGRLHEFAIRSALGAARSRLIAQVLTETALLASAGLFLGVFAGWELAHALVALITPAGEPAALSLKLGAAITLFAVVLTITAAALAGLWPAWRASRIAPALDLKQLSAMRKAGGLGRWIIPTQVALGLVLIYAALLMAGTLRSYLRESSGFVIANATMAQLSFQTDNPTDKVQIAKALQIVDDLETQPAIQSVALISMPPMHGWLQTSNYFTRDAAGNLHKNDQVWSEGVTPNYFPTVGTTILGGRGFTPSDIAGDKVCVISRAAANFFFPGQNPIGRFITSGDGTPPKPTSGDNAPPTAYRIVGIAEDARMQSLLKPAPFLLYHLIQQEKHGFVSQFLAVRSGNERLAAAAIQRTVARILPGAAPPKIYSFDQVVNDDLSRQRLLSSVSGGFALLALALVATGLYGILSRTVVERRREIGIRMALGAQRQQIVSNLARVAALRIAIGVLAGAGLASMAGRLLQSLLYGVTPASPVMAIATLAVLLAVLSLAFVFPAGRAASIDPMEAIRDE
jgi:putative ABC transport system permease protein